MVLYGMDASRYQGDVDWAAVNTAKDFAILKATDGLSYPYTGWYQRNAPRVRAAGLTQGAYHWLDAGPHGELHDPRGQARYFASIVGDFDGLLAVVDVEVDRDREGHVTSLPKIDSVQAFADEFARLTGGHPLLVYTGRWYWHDMIGNPHGAGIGPLWHSEYEATVGEIADGPELDNYGGWSKATLWQYTSSGRCPGVGGNVDLDVFFGDHSDLARLTGQETDQGGLFMSLSPEEEQEILTKVRDLHKRQFVPWIAATPESRARSMCYWVDGEEQTKVEVKIGGPMHDRVKALLSIAGLPVNAVDVTEAELPPTVS